MIHFARRRLLAVQNSEACLQKSDFVDYPDDPEGKTFRSKEEDIFTLKSAVLIFSSMLSFTTDIFSSAAVCYYLYLQGSIIWFVMSLVPLIYSMLVVNLFSALWYLHDRLEHEVMVGKVSRAHWALRIMFHCLFLGPVIRYLELIYYGHNSRDLKEPKRDIYKVLVLQEDRDSSLLALVGSFVKSAPQLVLQLYILMQERRFLGLTTSHAQATSVIASVVTLALSLSSYHRALRRSLPHKLNMTTMGTSLQFVSHFCIIGCRALTMAAFASVYHHRLFYAVASHWGVMVLWLLYQKTSFCSRENNMRRPFLELLFNAVMASVYIFCFLNIKDEPTKWKYTFYYMLVWTENVTLAILWYLKANPDLWYHLPLFLGVLISYVTGLTVLRLYYKYFHPNKVSKVTTFIVTPSS